MLKRRKAPSSGKHFDYDYGHVCRKTVPKQGSVHVRPLSGCLPYIENAASLISWRKELEKVRLHFNGEKLMKSSSKAWKAYSLFPLGNTLPDVSSPVQAARPCEPLTPLPCWVFYLVDDHRNISCRSTLFWRHTEHILRPSTSQFVLPYACSCNLTKLCVWRARVRVGKALTLQL